MMRFLQPWWLLLTTSKDTDPRQMIEYLKRTDGKPPAYRVGTRSLTGFVSQIFAVKSPEPEINRLPSGLNARE